MLLLTGCFDLELHLALKPDGGGQVTYLVIANPLLAEAFKGQTFFQGTEVRDVIRGDRFYHEETIAFDAVERLTQEEGRIQVQAAGGMTTLEHTLLLGPPRPGQAVLFLGRTFAYQLTLPMEVAQADPAVVGQVAIEPVVSGRTARWQLPLDLLLRAGGEVSFVVKGAGQLPGGGDEGPPRFLRPVRREEAVPSLGYGVVTEAGHHAGVDFMARSGRPEVLAVAEGTVFKVQQNGEGCRENRPGGGCEDHGLGNVVILEHRLPEGPLYSLYAHLDTISPDLEEGKRIELGAVIGRMGASGYGVRDYWRRPSVRGSLCGAYPEGEPCVHLHFELKTAPVLDNPVGGSACGGSPCWGYVPGDPQVFGYRDPGAYGIGR